MENNELLELKQYIIQKNNHILEQIKEKNNIRFNALEYKKYKTNIPTVFGTITFISALLVASKTLDYTTTKNILISILPAITVRTSLKKYFKYQRNKYQNQYPEINLETYNVEEEGKIITDMFEESFRLTEELGSINNELNQINNEENPKQIKVMTLTRKK